MYYKKSEIIVNTRQRKILGHLAAKRKITVNELIGNLDVSGVTIRQDLDFLQKEGFIQRVHGGAILQSDDEISHRLSINFDEKTAIAEKAAKMIDEGETIFIEAGSANALMARWLAERTRLTVITNNVFITRILKNSKANVILLGGMFQHQSECVVGALALKGMDSFNFTKVFLGVDGISPDGGVTCSEMSRGEISAGAVERCQQVFVLSDSSKVGKTAMYHICGLDQVDSLVTDNGITADAKVEFESFGMSVVVAN